MNYPAIKGEEIEFQETLDTLADFIKMIELLKPYEVLKIKLNQLYHIVF